METVTGWQDIVAESKIYFEAVYERLGVLLTGEDAIGESFYNSFLQVCTDLEERGIAMRSDGALCVFFDILGPDGIPAPLIVQKSDGGFGYATTDLAAIRYRAGILHARRILYVVDARQALHFRMVFETALRAGYLPDDVEAVHLGFGTVRDSAVISLFEDAGDPAVQVGRPGRGRREPGEPGGDRHGQERQAANRAVHLRHCARP